MNLTLQNMCKSIVGMANIDNRKCKISQYWFHLEMQDAYEQIVKLASIISMHELALGSSSDLFNSLSQKAFSGKL